MVSLSPDELVLFQGSAKYNGTRGKFYLTNKKVTFDYEQRGIFFKGQYTALDLPLERISTLSVVGAGHSRNLRLTQSKIISWLEFRDMSLTWKTPKNG